MQLVLRALVVALAVALASPALAVQPDEILSDPKLEQRARDLSLGLRCLVCQNQSIDDSDAPLARDLRVLVRERLKAGDSDAEVIDFVVARYGEFVLLKPRLGWHTLLLWLAPMLALLIAGAVVLRGMRGKRSSAPAALSAEEQRKLKALLDEK